MIAGLPLASWVLLIVAVGIGLALELAFYRAHAPHVRGREAVADGVGGRGEAVADGADGDDQATPGGPHR